MPSEADVRRFDAVLPDALPTATNASGERVTPTELEGMYANTPASRATASASTGQA